MGSVFPGGCDYQELGREVADGIELPVDLDPTGKVKEFLDNHIQKMVAELTGKAWKLSDGSVLECTWSQDFVLWDGRGVTGITPEEATVILKQALLDAKNEPEPKKEQNGGGKIRRRFMGRKS